MAINGALKLLVVKILSINNRDGVSIIKDVKEKTGWKVSYGSFYPLMKDLVHAKIVKFEKESKSKIYSLTSKGKKLLEDIETKKKEILDKIYEGVKFLEILEEEDFATTLKKNLYKKPLNLICLNEQLIRQGEILAKIDISKHRDSINNILNETNRKLERLK